VNRRDLWKAPEDDGGVLVDPPLEKAEELLEINRRRLDGAKVRINHRSLQEVRQEARRVALEWAMHSLADDVAVPRLSAPIVACGHQPELFHPGVWIKDFAADRFGEGLGAFPLHVVVDTDLLKTTCVAFPFWDPDPHRVSVEQIAYDRFTPNTAHWARPIFDDDVFEKFPESTRHIWRHWNFEPLLPAFWKEVVESANMMREGTRSLGYDPVAVLWICLSGARRSVEREWGCNVAEARLSLLPITAFFCQILSDIADFHADYNECVRSYRKAHRMRSATHPVPDLITSGEYFEAPFWWLDTDGSRHRLFVRTHGDAATLTRTPPVGEITIPLRANEPLGEMNAGGVRIAPRALTTTMFLRLCVADLFIHGIGGAKYDELTDDIIRRYFGIEPPEYMVVSGTLRLPFEDKLFPRFGCWNPRRKARDVLWNPERYILSDNPNARQLIVEKHDWIEQQPADSAGRRERFFQLHNLTMRLRDYVTDEQKEAEADLQRCEAEVAANRILTNREYSFVLYPEEKLRPFLTQFLK